MIVHTTSLTVLQSHCNWTLLYQWMYCIAQVKQLLDSLLLILQTSEPKIHLKCNKKAESSLQILDFIPTVLLLIMYYKFISHILVKTNTKWKAEKTQMKNNKATGSSTQKTVRWIWLRRLWNQDMIKRWYKFRLECHNYHC
jgi:hypothetical protein